MTSHGLAVHRLHAFAVLVYRAIHKNMSVCCNPTMADNMVGRSAKCFFSLRKNEKKNIDFPQKSTLHNDLLNFAPNLYPEFHARMEQRNGRHDAFDYFPGRKTVNWSEFVELLSYFC